MVAPAVRETLPQVMLCLPHDCSVLWTVAEEAYVTTTSPSGWKRAMWKCRCQTEKKLVVPCLEAASCVAFYRSKNKKFCFLCLSWAESCHRPYRLADFAVALKDCQNPQLTRSTGALKRTLCRLSESPLRVQSSPRHSYNYPQFITIWILCCSFPIAD